MKILLLVILIAGFNGIAKADAQSDFVSLTNALFTTLGLANPTGLQNCWNASSSDSFFKWLNSTYLVYSDIMKGNLSQYVLIDSVNQMRYIQATGDNWKCTIKTNDFMSLLSKLNFQNFTQFQDPKLLYNAVWALSAAYPNVVQTLLSPVMAALQVNTPSVAGVALAALLKAINYSNFETQYAAYEIIAWHNGLFLGVSLPFPSAAAQCFAQLSASQLVPLKNFYDGLFKALYNKRILETKLLTQAYYNGNGKVAYNLIPKTLWDCLNSSADTKALKTVFSFGMDPYDQCYTNAMYAYIGASYDNAYEYNTILNKIYTSWLPDYFDATAYTYKQLLRDINVYAKC